MTVYLQPYDFSIKEVEAVQRDLGKKFSPLVEVDIDYVILENMQLTDEPLNDKKTRYRARKIIEWQPDRNGVTIGLTHKDISTTAHGVGDYGILGLGFKPGNSCIVSDYRVRNKHDLWKVACHEFIHAFYGYDHCPEDDTTCIIKDAKGKENLPKKYHLCKTCTGNLNKTRK